MEFIEVLRNDIASFVDCRIYHDFNHVISMKPATYFMNARKGKYVDTQIVTLRQAEFSFVQRIHGAVRYNDISEQYEISIATIEKIKKCKRLVGMFYVSFLDSCSK